MHQNSMQRLDVSDSLELATKLVDSVLKLPDWQVKFFGGFKLKKNCNQSCF